MYGNLLSNTMAAPPMKELFDKRPTERVFEMPRSPLRDPNSMQFRNTVLPTVPGAPITIGMMQVIYDGEPQWDRGDTCKAGPVRRFFLRWINNQNEVRQP